MFRNRWDQSSGSDEEEYNDCISLEIKNQNRIVLGVAWTQKAKIGSLDG